MALETGRAGSRRLWGCFLMLAFFCAGQLGAAGTAFVHARVRVDLRQGGQAKVIVTIAETTLQAPPGTTRAAALHAASRRIAAEVPGLRVRREFTRFPFLAATVEAAQLDQLSQLPEVTAVYPDWPMHAVLNQSGPLVGQPAAEAAGFTGKGVTIAIIDTGIDITHPALGGNVTHAFTDFFPGSAFWQEVEGAAEHGIVSGFPDGSYQPAQVVTRDQMAVFIARAAAGGDANVPSGPSTPTFPDVPVTSFAYKYIEFVKAQGIVTGFPDGSYGPAIPVDRAQMAVFIARAVAGSDSAVPPGPTTATFPDVPTTFWAFRYIEYLHAQGVVQGFSDGDYHPEVLVTRDQMAAFIVRGFHLAWDGRVLGGTNVLSGQDPADTLDDNGHGTAVAGIAASSDPVYRGMAPDANLVSVKALNSLGSGNSSDTIAGIEWCLQNQAAFNLRAINLSEGDGVDHTDYVPGDNPTLDDPQSVAITSAVNAGLAVTAASGNDGFTTGLNLPAAAADAISVGSTKDGGPEADAQPVDGISSFSNRGELLNLYAPGAVITSTALGGGFVSGEGTSFSAPHVAGTVAVLWQKGIHDPRQIKSLLLRTGVQIIDPATEAAAPRLNMAAAINPPTMGPDLTVTAISTPTTSLAVGSTIAVTLTIRNQGNRSAAACSAVVVLSANSVASPQDAESDSQTGVLLANVSVPALAAGQTFSPTGLTATIPSLPPGTFFLGAFVDSTYMVPELDETNNGLVNSGAVVMASRRAAARALR